MTHATRRELDSIPRRGRLVRALAQVCAVAAVVVLALWPRMSAAQDVLVDRASAPIDVDPLLVAVLPAEIPVFMDLDDPVAGPDPVVVAHALRSHLSGHRYLQLMTATEVGSELRTTEVARALDTSRLKLGYGQQFFHGFDPVSAVRDLDAARGGLEGNFGLYLESGAYADTLQYLAFALLDMSVEDGASDTLIEARIAMRELVRVAPHIILDPDRQPARRVELYRDARRAVLGDRSLRAPAQLHALRVTEALGADYTLFPRLVQVGDAWQLEVDVFAASRRGFLDEIDPVPIGAGDDSRLGDLVDARFSRLTACMTPRLRPPEPAYSDAGRVFVDLGFDYFVFAQSPTRDPFDNLGVSFGLSYMVNDLFSLTARGIVTFTGDDKAQDLQSTFTTLRGMVGVGLAVPLRWIRPFLYAGLEAAHATPFSVTRNPQCKVTEDPVVQNPLCLASDIRRYEQGLLLGLFVTAGVSINVGIDALFATARTTLSYYMPLPDEPATNLPIGFDLGLELRF